MFEISILQIETVLVDQLQADQPGLSGQTERLHSLDRHSDPGLAGLSSLVFYSSDSGSRNRFEAEDRLSSQLKELTGDNIFSFLVSLLLLSLTLVSSPPRNDQKIASSQLHGFDNAMDNFYQTNSE